MVEADDGQLYFVKTDTNGRPTRACEWLSTGMAEYVGISAPTPSPIQMKDGQVVFGSRKLSNSADAVATANFLLNPSHGNQHLGLPSMAGLTALTSAIYVFDMFMFNDDRHFGNYLSHDDSGTRRLYAFDFSRALFWAWPWNGFPPSGCNTRNAGQMIRSVHGFDAVVANSTLDRLDALSPAAVEGLFKAMPSNWLPTPIWAQFYGWWVSDRSARVSDLRKGINDGSLL